MFLKYTSSEKQENYSMAENESSTSSEEDEDACELTENVEKNFFRALSCLKKKDPKIYNEDSRFFEKTPEIDENTFKEKKKKKTDKPFTLRDYETNKLKNGDYLDDEEDTTEPIPKNKFKKTYVQEQKDLKESFKKVLFDDSDNDNEDAIGGLLLENQKSKKDQEKEDDEYREWLKGQRDNLDDEKSADDLKYLHDYWNDPSLDQNEKFLRDYILNKKFLDKEDDSETENPDKLVTLEEDEEILNKQTEFEHKYNFRFEEPDEEFIKRFPRSMENTMRMKDNKRKLKREEAKKRKQEEKKKKLKELKKLKAEKLKEIEEKIKETTGSNKIGFKKEYIEKDFDPDEHDLQMQKLFSEEFYTQEENDKPQFTEDLNLDEFKIEEEDGYFNGDNNYEENYCEDEDFNMDCDYTPEKAALAKKKKLEAREKKKNKKKVNSATEMINLKQVDSKSIPVFDEKLHKKFQNYLDEYYSLDCEDFIGDMPCRFKYRKVEPNSFGLTIEEILAADDKELNSWCSINKITRIRPGYTEKYDVKAYTQKSMNEELKRKILPSLYKSKTVNEPEENSNKKKKKKKKKKNSQIVQSVDSSTPLIEKSRKRKHNDNLSDNPKKTRKLENVSVPVSDNFKTKSYKFENDSVTTVKNESEKISNDDLNINTNKDNKSESIKKENRLLNNNINAKNVKNNGNKSKKRKGKNKNSNNSLNNEESNSKPNLNKKKTNKAANKIDVYFKDLSDSRLKAYGIKPKKFKNKLKYGN